jgi:hypothetical protein
MVEGTGDGLDAALGGADAFCVATSTCGLGATECDDTISERRGVCEPVARKGQP